MEVITARTAGFCFGVNRAVETVYKEIESGTGDVYTLGPVVHNETVVDEMKQKGVKVLNSVDEATEGTVIIRAHGVGRKVYEILEEKGIKVVDATCPFVKKIHKLVQKAGDEGRKVVIVGNADHPEVIGIKGWAPENAKIVASFEEFQALNLDPHDKITVVAQTTFNHDKYKIIVAKLGDLYYDLECFNTVCNATQERQEEADYLASQVESMIVIGDKASSNTQKLVEICSERCSRTIFIRNVDDLKWENLHTVYKVGITAGASTPKNIIEEVQNYVRNEF